MRAMSSTAAVSRRTGRSPLRATAQPATPAVMMPAMPNSSVTRPSLVSSCCCGSSDWAITSAMPGGS